MKKLNRRPNSNFKIPMVPSHLSISPKYKKVILIASIALIGTAVILLSTSSAKHKVSESDEGSSGLYSVEVVNEYPHDPEAFTQGILYAENDILFESTGLYGRSSLRKVSLESGKVLDIYKMDRSLFGEGLTLIGDRLFQVTWKENSGLVYNRNNFSQFEKFTHEMLDGWGLGTDGKVLFGTDGTSILYQMDPRTFKVIKKQTITYKGEEVRMLNELEFINGQVWANIWQSNCIARISPKTGTVLGWIMLDKLRQGLLASGARGIDVLNGIAWDKDQNRIFVTGKLWPKLYEVKLHPMRTPLNMDVGQICMRGASHRQKALHAP